MPSKTVEANNRVVNIKQCKQNKHRYRKIFVHEPSKLSPHSNTIITPKYVMGLKRRHDEDNTMNVVQKKTKLNNKKSGKYNHSNTVQNKWIRL